MAKTWLTLAFVAAAAGAAAAQKNAAPTVTIIGVTPGEVTITVDFPVAPDEILGLSILASNVTAISQATQSSHGVVALDAPPLPLSNPETWVLSMKPGVVVAHHTDFHIGVSYQALSGAGAGGGPAWGPNAAFVGETYEWSEFGQAFIRPDFVAPDTGAVAVDSAHDDGFTVAVTMPGDEGDPVALFEVRYSTTAWSGDGQLWSAGAGVGWSQAGTTPGQPLLVDLVGLSPGTPYWVAIVAFDQVGNIGYPTQAAQGTTSGTAAVSGGASASSAPSCGGTATSSAVLSMLLPLLAIFRRSRA